MGDRSRHCLSHYYFPIPCGLQCLFRTFVIRIHRGSNFLSAKPKTQFKSSDLRWPLRGFGCRRPPVKSRMDANEPLFLSHIKRYFMYAASMSGTFLITVSNSYVLMPRSFPSPSFIIAGCFLNVNKIGAFLWKGLKTNRTKSKKAKESWLFKKSIGI